MTMIEIDHIERARVGYIGWIRSTALSAPLCSVYFNVFLEPSAHVHDVDALAQDMALQRLSGSFSGLIVQNSSKILQRAFSVSVVAAAIQKMTRVRVVDNSSLGNTPYHRPPRVIHVYTKNGVGKVGDKVLLAIKGQKKKALIVGHKMPGDRMTPRFDSNNVVLIEDNGNPTGTRIKVPIPTHLRQMEGDFSKVLAIASSFV
uniref:Large ribosomal subunit protein uL14m n=2 Tax=Oryzias latipes TaxID=8090 RepID=A0A3P9L3E1_ORYLA